MHSKDLDVVEDTQLVRHLTALHEQSNEQQATDIAVAAGRIAEISRAEIIAFAVVM